MDSQCLMFTSASKKDVDLCMTNVYFLFVFFQMYCYIVTFRKTKNGP